MPADGSGSELQFKGNFKIPLDDEYINEALNFLFRKGSDEVRNFISKEKIKKICVENEDILFCRIRIVEGQRFILVGE